MPHLVSRADIPITGEDNFGEEHGVDRQFGVEMPTNSHRKPYKRRVSVLSRRLQGSLVTIVMQHTP